ncbi:MAG TPA: M48 family metallopeptidase [Candidatus Omnitrophota bacterium]|nr:M48 family metallopeptidase [Candidatus Omnitrophota bacterium]HPT07819.1 M48 family metallopeptidase [Candidatus Omnitrophota bacterium]
MDELALFESRGITDVHVIRSKRRRRTAGAKLKGSCLHVCVPYSISEEHLARLVITFKEKFNKTLLRNRLNRDTPLSEVAERLNKKYFCGSLKIGSVHYVTNQTRKFGCCYIQDASIRISHRIAEMPDWVRDYVVMHELAHLVVPNHKKAFWDIVSRYELAERARGFLIAKGMEMDNPDEEETE